MVFFLSAAMSRLVTLTCPHCGHKKRVERRDRPVKFRICPKCHKRYDASAKPKRG